MYCGFIFIRLIPIFVVFVGSIKPRNLVQKEQITSEVICKYQNSEFDINERLNQCKSTKIGTNENK